MCGDFGVLSITYRLIDSKTNKRTTKLANWDAYAVEDDVFMGLWNGNSGYEKSLPIKEDSDNKISVSTAWLLELDPRKDLELSR